MKKITFYFIFISVIVFGCKNNSQNNTNTADVDTDAVNDVSIIDDEDDNISNIDDSDPIADLGIEKIADVIKKYNSDTYHKFLEYVKLLNAEIDSQEKIEEIFDKRMEIKNDIAEAISDFYGVDYGPEEEIWTEVLNELHKIGYDVAYIEGMFGDLVTYPILSDEIDDYASDEFKYYYAFKDANDVTVGGEYPYDYLVPYYDAVVIAEKLYNINKDSKYFKDIRADLYFCLSAVLDIHKVNLSNGNTDCFNGDLHTDYYPFASNCADWETIISKYPNSMFIPIIKELQQNVSTIDVNVGNGITADIYFVAVDKKDDYEQADDAILDYLLEGKGIVHSIMVSVENSDDFEYYIGYRFYTDEDMAKQQLDNIIDDFPMAKIVHLKYDPDAVKTTLAD